MEMDKKNDIFFFWNVDKYDSRRKFKNIQGERDKKRENVFINSYRSGFLATATMIPKKGLQMSTMILICGTYNVINT